jgi:hypothetical protein
MRAYPSKLAVQRNCVFIGRQANMPRDQDRPTSAAQLLKCPTQVNAPSIRGRLRLLVDVSAQAARCRNLRASATHAQSVGTGIHGPLSDISLTAGVAPHEGGCHRTRFSNQFAEMALAHAVGDKVEAAYRRGNLFEKRVLLMSDWAAFLENKKAGSRSR